MNRELPDVQAGFRKGRGTGDQIANIRGIIEKARSFNKNICFIDYAKSFDCVDHNKLWNILQEMGIPDHLTCLLRNLTLSDPMDCSLPGSSVHGIFQARVLEWGATAFSGRTDVEAETPIHWPPDVKN